MLKRALPASVLKLARAWVRRAGSDAYGSRLERENAHFAQCVNVHDLPQIFHYWSNKYLAPKLESLGFRTHDDLFASQLERGIGAEAARFVSIGAGNCDTEVRIARRLLERGHRDFVIECVEINEAMLERGAELAASEGVGQHIRPVRGDFNRWRADGRCDAVMANQSLHHVTRLEELFDEIGRAIEGRGVFVTSDMIGRNGHQRWPEALGIVQEFWQELPVAYRFNRQLERPEERFLDWDCAQDGFEGIRAQDILALLVERFDFDLFAPFANVIDPFIDRSFGHNFDAEAPWDRDFIDRVHARDELELRRGAIKPTHLMASMGSGRTAQRRYLEGFQPAACIRRP